jgi:hypothetical protein
MRKIAAWQVTFLAGVVFLLISVSVVFGSGTLTSLVALIALIVAFLHSLMAPEPRAAGDSHTWLSQFVRRSLQVSKILVVSTLVIWIAIVGITSYGASIWWNALHTATVRGIVLTESGVPVSGAVVTLQQDSRDVSARVTKDGSFEFPNITLTRSNNVLRVDWRGKIAKVTIEKSNASALRITLPVAEARMRVLYFEIYGHAIDLLLRGELKGGWERGITVENSSDQPIEIDWNGSSFIDTTRSAKRIFHSGVKYTDREQSLPNTTVPPLAKVEEAAIPTANVYYSEGSTGGWREEPLLPTMIRPDLAETAMRTLKGAKVALFLQLLVTGKKTPVTLTFEVSDVRPGSFN